MQMPMQFLLLLEEERVVDIPMPILLSTSSFPLLLLFLKILLFLLLLLLQPLLVLQPLLPTHHLKQLLGCQRSHSTHVCTGAYASSSV
jgi:hypothetical protein